MRGWKVNDRIKITDYAFAYLFVNNVLYDDDDDAECTRMDCNDLCDWDDCPVCSNLKK